jgi:hypothetical protein
MRIIISWIYSRKRQKCEKSCGYIPLNLKIAKKFIVSRRARGKAMAAAAGTAAMGKPGRRELKANA